MSALVEAAPSALNLPELNQDELLRYSRHLTLPEVGEAGQRRLKAARVLLVGAGGLGAPASLYLAAAGVGHLGLVDPDRVDVTNLQRQVLYSTADAGRPKLAAAAERLRGITPHLEIAQYEERLSSQNALAILRGYDLVVDGTDNFPTRYLVNDACVLSGIPNVYASVFRFEGQASLLAAPDGPCYRCWYPEPPPPGLVPSCAEGGVLGVLPGIMGLIQATEAVKWILGIGEPLRGRVLLFDALGMRFRQLELRRDPNCPVCGTHPSITRPIDYEQFCGMPGAVPEIAAAALEAEMRGAEAPFLLDVREPKEYEIARIAGATLIPLGQLAARLEELARNREIVVHCKSGVRSARATRLLLDAGFRVRNLRGGILAWSDEVDASVPKY